MDFNLEMQKVVESVEDSLACSLVGFDGICVGTYIKPNAVLDTELMGAELSGLLSQLRHSSTVQETGEPDEFFYSSEKCKMLLRVITPDYFVALAIGPEGLVGKARHKLRLLSAGIKDELL